MTTPATGVAPGPVTVKVAALMVAAFMASLNVAEMVVLTATAVAPFTGTVETTLGGGAVVKAHTKLAARALPWVLCAAGVTVAVYWVLAARAAVGAKVAVLLGAS